jgi:threonine dehydrogenase-like Zn-dependent dehydrogenase
LPLANENFLDAGKEIEGKMKFKRAFLTEPYKFEIRETEENIASDQIMVKIASCGLCNWELNFWKGNLNFYGYPHPLGHEFSGYVTEAGKQASDFAVGDKVSVFKKGFGGFSEYCAVHMNNARKLADDIDPKYALGEPQKCVMTVLRAVRPEAGDCGIALGCGAMGLWVIMGLAGNYLSELIAIDIDEKKLDLAKKYGATKCLNPNVENIAERLSEITDGRLADFVVEGTGIPSVLNDAQRYLKNGKGKLVLMSSHEQACKEFDFRQAIDKSLELIVAHPGFSSDEYDDFRRGVNGINKHVFETRELVTHTWKLSEINEAFYSLENKPDAYLKGIIIPD